MSKLHEYLYGSESLVEYPEDVARLQKDIPEIRHLSPTMVAKMYSDFSDHYAAGWLILDDDRIQEFRSWLTR